MHEAEMLEDLHVRFMQVHIQSQKVCGRSPEEACATKLKWNWG
jgi:hypothetical protein